MQHLSRLVLAFLLLACSRTASEGVSLPGERESRIAERDGRPAVASPEIPADAPVVVFLGDSITAGLHLSLDEAFPAVLQRELLLDGAPFRLVNAGVSGDTTAGGLKRIDWVLRNVPAIVVIELGANDGLRGQDLDGVERNLRAIIERVKGASAKVLLLGMNVPPSLGFDYAAKFEELYERVADETGVTFAPDFLEGVGGVPAMNLEDGLHPTAKGHERLASNVQEALKELLESL
jgi:acyl-CoA thioesterase-1